MSVNPFFIDKYRHEFDGFEELFDKEEIFRHFSFKIPFATRVWTQFSQHLIAKMWSMDRKFRFSFSYRVVRRRISFILQKNRSTSFRMA